MFSKKEIDDMVACARREVGMRQRVYPGRVLREAMTQSMADREIETMQNICRLLAKLQEGRYALTNMELF